MSQVNIKEQNKILKSQNKRFRRVLKVVKLWMQKEVKSNVLKIAKSKLSSLTDETKNTFLNDNIEEIISKKISGFFWEILILNIPFSVIDNIISAEVNFYNLKENQNLDWLSVISSYHKSMDILIEQYIIKWYRKFCKKNWYNVLRQNELIEKSLNSVVNRWYILSIWRLYHLIKILKDNDQKNYDYVSAFEKYLNKYTHIKEILMNEDFYKKIQVLVSSDILWSKRHKWKIKFSETKNARNIIIWNFKHKDCLLYKLVKIQEIDY